MRITAGLVGFFAAILVAAASAHATQIRINDSTTFFDNYENATNAAPGAIPTAQYTSPNSNPDNPQAGYWYSFQGTDTEASPPTAFSQNVQVTDNVFSNTAPLSPGAFSGVNYLRAFRTPNLTPDSPFESNPGAHIVQGPIGTPTATVAGDIYRFETMISAQFALTSGTTQQSLTVYQLVDSNLGTPDNPLSGVDMISIAFRTNGDIFVNGTDSALDWATDGSWQKMMIDYTDGTGTFTLSYGDQVSSPLAIASASNGHALRTSIGNGTGGNATSINGGLGSRVYYDSVALEPVPEPGSILLLGFGMIGFYFWKTRRS